MCVQGIISWLINGWPPARVSSMKRTQDCFSRVSLLEHSDCTGVLLTKPRIMVAVQKGHVKTASIRCKATPLQLGETQLCLQGTCFAVKNPNKYKIAEFGAVVGEKNIQAEIKARG